MKVAVYQTSSILLDLKFDGFVRSQRDLRVSSDYKRQRKFLIVSDGRQ